MPWIFGEKEKPRTDPNPNVRDTINKLIPPPLQESHKAQQPTNVDPAVEQDEMQVNVVTNIPSSSTPQDLIDPTTSTNNHMPVDVFNDSTAASTSTTEEQMQGGTGQALPQHGKNWSSTVPIGQDHALNKGNVKIGPWGGRGGGPWEWNGPIQKIFVSHGTVVDSVSFGFIKDGVSVWSGTFGNFGGNSSEISIEEPEEYLVTIKGTIGRFRSVTSLITSLTIISNKCSYGPFGKDTTNGFSIPVQGVKIVGFHGRCGRYLDAIGFNIVPSDLPKAISPISSDSAMGDVMKIGPWGGQRGGTWEWNSPIQKILVKHGTVVDSITFGFIQNGATMWSERFGGDGGQLSEITIKDPEEYLVAIRGTTGLFRTATPHITSLTFLSNKCSYGPFGRDTANQFYIPVQGGKIIGFHGRCEQFLDAIGITLVPLGLPKNISPIWSDSGMGNVVKIGPWGGQGGRTWDWDGPIHKILVKHETRVNSIIFGSVKNATTVWSGRFGRDSGQITEISIKEPEEYLVAIKGSIGFIDRPTPIVTSLTFISNRCSYGPFGTDTANQFSIPMQGGKIVGFYGRYGSFLDSIGIKLVPLGLPKHIPPICSDSGVGNILKMGPWGGQGGKTWEWDGPIQKILVKHGTVVDSITFGSIKDGSTIWSQRFGGNRGEPSEISIEEPEEYLVAIRGTTGLYRSPTPVITSLTFISNKCNYGPFGKDTVNNFSIPVQRGKIVGFNGRSGLLLDAIGFNLAPLGP